ncbi:MAG: sigma factor, partial [Polyangiaceae bacterium]
MTLHEIYQRHADFAWRTLRRLGVREAEANDAVQDVFVVVHAKLSQFEGRSS